VPLPSKCPAIQDLRSLGPPERIGCSLDDLLRAALASLDIEGRPGQSIRRLVCARTAQPRYKRRRMNSVPPRALSHPLPAGMRDLLPEEARRRRALARRVLEHFALHGYQLVTPPAFEFAEVIERGLGTLDPADLIRFVEPDSGEVAALRPDMTPQIARMVATRLLHMPRPIRLCYEGTVVRRRQGRARRHRQIPQAGVELYGAPALEGELEVLRLAASSARRAGLEDFVLDLGHASIARALIDALPPTLAPEVAEALTHKDATRIEGLLAAPAASGVPLAIVRALVELGELHGGGRGDVPDDTLSRRASALCAATPAEGPLRELWDLWEAARRADEQLAAVLRLDLGEVRGFAYYTGAIFHILAPGPGEPIGAGGRYDDLLARFDAPMPAVGFALSLDAVAWALMAAGKTEPSWRGVLIEAGEQAERIAAALRAAGVAAVIHAIHAKSDSTAKAYAEAWGFSHLATVIDRDGQRLVLTRVGEDGAIWETALDANFGERVAARVSRDVNDGKRASTSDLKV